MKKTDTNIKSIRYNKTSAIVFLIFIFILANLMPIFAVENKYNNQLLKLNINKSSKDKVNITVTTSKPYKIKLTPMKRSDNEYVILLPDTYHSITTKPDISKIGDLQDIDVKLIPYIGSQNNNNGYTKITVRTKSNDTKLNINDEVSGQRLTINNELSKLISQNTLKPVAIKTANSKIVLKNKLTLNNKNQEKTVQKPEQISKASIQKFNNTDKSRNTNPISSKSTVTVPQKTTVQVQENDSKDLKPVIKQAISTPLPSKNLQPVTNTNSLLPKKDISVKKQSKSDNTSIKLVLISLIAVLVLFIVVIRYFKSKLMKQMHQAEKKIINSKTEMPLSQKPQDVVKQKSNIYQQRVKKAISKSTSQVPISSNKPKLANNNNIRVIKGFQIEDNKAIYLIQTRHKMILIGIIDSEVFLLKEFSNITELKFIVRKEKTLRTKSVYYVQINNWRSLVSVAQDNIKLELVLDKTLVAQ